MWLYLFIVIFQQYFVHLKCKVRQVRFEKLGWWSYSQPTGKKWADNKGWTDKAISCSSCQKAKTDLYSYRCESAVSGHSLIMYIMLASCSAHNVHEASDVDCPDTKFYCRVHTHPSLKLLHQSGPLLRHCHQLSLLCFISSEGNFSSSDSLPFLPVLFHITTPFSKLRVKIFDVSISMLKYEERDGEGPGEM